MGFADSFTTLLLMTMLGTDPLRAIDDVESIGFGTDRHHDAGSSGTIVVTLWYNYTIYTYSRKDVSPNTTYTAYAAYKNSSLTFTNLGLYDCPGPDPLTAKVQITNDWVNGVYIDFIRFDTSSGNWYGIDEFCIDNSSVPVGWHGIYWEILDNECGSGYKHYSAFCVDNEDIDCAPLTQMFEFDVSSPNIFSTNALWSDGSNVSASAISGTCPPTLFPSEDPSADPTISATLESTIYTISIRLNCSQTPCDIKQDVVDRISDIIVAYLDTDGVILKGDIMDNEIKIVIATTRSIVLDKDIISREIKNELGDLYGEDIDVEIEEEPEEIAEDSSFWEDDIIRGAIIGGMVCIVIMISYGVCTYCKTQKHAKAQQDMVATEMTTQMDEEKGNTTANIIGNSPTRKFRKRTDPNHTTADDDGQTVEPGTVETHCDDANVEDSDESGTDGDSLYGSGHESHDGEKATTTGGNVTTEDGNVTTAGGGVTGGSDC